MKKIVLICSHQHSGSSALYWCMSCNPRIQGVRVGYEHVYDHPLTFYAIANGPHKHKTNAAIYMDELIFNHQLRTKSAYEICKFIYLVRPPTDVIPHLATLTRHSPETVVRAYLFRLRRLCEMAKKTPGAVLLTFEELERSKGIDTITDYLGLKQPIWYDPRVLDPVKVKVGQIPVDTRIMERAEEGFERYLYFLKSLDLRRPSSTTLQEPPVGSG